jgi:hypothetical protein
MSVVRGRQPGADVEELTPASPAKLSSGQPWIDSLKRLGQVRLEPERLPDPAHAGLGQSRALRYRRPRPMRGSFGVDSSVATTTSSTCSSVIFLGAPGRSSSTSPSSRRSRNRTATFPPWAATPPTDEQPPHWTDRQRTPERSGTAAPVPGRFSLAATTAAASHAPHRTVSVPPSGDHDRPCVEVCALPITIPDRHDLIKRTNFGGGTLGHKSHLTGQNGSSFRAVIMSLSARPS